MCLRYTPVADGRRIYDLAGVGADADGVEAGGLAVELHVEVVGVLTEPRLHLRLGAAHLHPRDAHRLTSPGALITGCPLGCM